MTSPYYNQIGSPKGGNTALLSLPVWNVQNRTERQIWTAGRVILTLKSMKFLIQYYGYNTGDGAFRVIGTWSSGTTQNSAVDVVFQNAYTLDTAAQIKAAIITEVLAYAVANSISLSSSDIVFPDFDVLATVATTGSYTDLINKPSLPSGTTYQALVSQSGTSAPTATVGENDFGGTTFTWARTGAGTYTLTASAATFTSGKTAVINSQLNNPLANFTYTVTSSTVITIKTTLNSILTLILTPTNTDALLSNTMVYVIVYP